MNKLNIFFCFILLNLLLFSYDSKNIIEFKGNTANEFIEVVGNLNPKEEYIIEINNEIKVDREIEVKNKRISIIGNGKFVCIKDIGTMLTIENCYGARISGIKFDGNNLSNEGIKIINSGDVL